MPPNALGFPIDACSRAAFALIDARGEHTRAAYRADFERWLRFCHAHELSVAEPSLETATKFRDEHLYRQLGLESSRRTLAALSFVYARLFLKRIATSNPFHPKLLDWPAASTFGKTPAVPEEVAQRMLSAAVGDQTLRGLRDHAILRLLYDTGMRRESIARLRRDGFVREKRRRLLRFTVKGGRTEETELGPVTVQALEAWLTEAPPSVFVFPARRRGQQGICVTTINKLVTARALEVKAEEPVHPHCFRAAFITAAYDAGVRERDIQVAVHHGDPRTTQRYDRGSRGGGVLAAVAHHRGDK
jgi:site-specific recombinase XerD